MGTVVVIGVALVVIGWLVESPADRKRRMEELDELVRAAKSDDSPINRAIREANERMERTLEDAQRNSPLARYLRRP